ncbi:MAG: hypothetical protein U9N34_05190, partial [Candidatus Cloacimonadota bacterium]|nr:hypothetical protein [Candidatus Cloacimonadota bacterium]
SIDFGEVEFDTNPKEREELRAMQLVNGTKNEIDFLIEDNPDLSREDAIEKFKEMEEEKKLYQIGTGFEEILSDGK